MHIWIKAEETTISVDTSGELLQMFTFFLISGVNLGHGIKIYKLAVAKISQNC